MAKRRAKKETESTEEVKETKKVSKPKAVTSDRVSAVSASERTSEEIKTKMVEVVALKGNKHLKEGDKYTIGAQLAKDLLRLKRVKLA